VHSERGCAACVCTAAQRDVIDRLLERERSESLRAAGSTRSSRLVSANGTWVTSAHERHEYDIILESEL
jgi:hypothetical protein